MFNQLCRLQVAEILKDRPSWFRDCRAVDVINVLSTGSGGTIELFYMQVPTSCYMVIISDLKNCDQYCVVCTLQNFALSIWLELALCTYYFGTCS